MSDQVRELYVTLSLNATDFDKHIRAANKQIKEAESEFKNAAAGSEKFEKTLNGMSEKAKSLKKQLGAAEEIVSQYSGKVNSLNEQLQEEISKSKKLGDQLEEETKERNRLRKAVEEQEEAVAVLQKAYGDDDGRVAQARDELAEYAKQLKASEENVKRLGKATEENRNQIYKTGNALADTKTALNNAEAEVKELTIELNKNENAWYTHGVAMQNFATQALAASKSVERVGDTLTRTVTTPLLGLGVAAGKAAIDYESAFADVRKTVNVTGEDAEAFFEGLSDSALDMSKTLATSADDITEVMAIAGQLGIANEELESFTETIVRLGMSTNLAGEDAASSMARFANITGMAQSEFENFGATLVYLGNNFATTESEIMAMAVRIAAAGKQVGLSESQILGFSAALSSLGLEAEAGGSAFSTALKKMETAVATGSDALTDFANVAGLTREEFAALWESDPAGAFQSFIVGLSQMDENGMSAVATLNEIGITQLRLSDTLLRTANATELLENAQTSANQAWAEGTALIAESDVRLKTTASRLTNAKNSLVTAGISFGETMTPEIERMVGWLEKAVDWFGSLDDSTRRSIVNWGLFAAATGPVIKGVGKVGASVGDAIDIVGRFAEKIGDAQATMKATGSTASLLGTVLGPGGTFMVGVAGATAAIAALIALNHKLESEKPDLSIDTSEIENLKIDVDDIEVKAKADVSVELKEGIKSAKEQIVEILNDGLPEGEEEQKAMSQSVQNAIGLAYQGITDKFEDEQTTLDNLFSAGIIDKATYDQSLSDLQGQATTMQNELDSASKAVTDYISTLVAQNRATTDEEIAELDRLLAALGETAEKVALANDAQMQVYESAYQKARLGIGDETDQQFAVEYIELQADKKLQELKAHEDALRQLYSEKIGTAQDDEEIIQLAEEEAEALNRLEEARKAVYGEKQGMQGEILPGLLQGSGVTVEELKEYLVLLERLGEVGIDPTDGMTWNERLAARILKTDDVQLMDDELAKLEDIAKRLDESGLFEEDSIINRMLATNASQGLISEETLGITEGFIEALAKLAEGAGPATAAMNQLQTDVETTSQQIMPGAAKAVEDTEGDFLDAMQGAAAAGSEIFPKAFDMHSPSRVMYNQGLNIMAGLRNGIIAGQSGVMVAMRSAALAAVAAAKEALGIHSPSKVFEDEVGTMAMKGFGSGFSKEAENQAKIIRNAARYLTDEAQAGAIAGNTDNSRTYSSESNVTVTGNTFVVNDRQDIQSLATEIASLTRAQQRGRGVRYA